MNDTVIEQRQLSIASAAQKVLDAREKKKRMKELVDRFLDKDEEYVAAKELASDTRSEQKTLKDKLLTGSEEGKKVWREYDNVADQLKGAEDMLSGMLEAESIKSGHFTVEAGGVQIVMKRKFSLGTKQLRLFE